MNDPVFSGFPPEGPAFLGELARENSKPWFDANRAGWDDALVAPAKAFVAEAGARVQEFAPEVIADPRINGSIMRINRDVRFSADKTPYKDHLDLMFWAGEARGHALSVFFFRLTVDRLILGAGSHAFTKDTLERYRNVVADKKHGAKLVALVAELATAGHEIGGEHYKRLPRGYEVTAEREPLIRHNALWASRDEPHPPLLSSPGFIDYCVDYWQQVAPLHRWIVDTLA